MRSTLWWGWLENVAVQILHKPTLLFIFRAGASNVRSGSLHFTGKALHAGMLTILSTTLRLDANHSVTGVIAEDNGEEVFGGLVRTKETCLSCSSSVASA